MGRNLDLSFNYIESIPTEMGRLNELRHLNLSNNMITKLPNEFINLTKLAHCNLKNNPLDPVMQYAHHGGVSSIKRLLSHQQRENSEQFHYENTIEFQEKESQEFEEGAFESQEAESEVIELQEERTEDSLDFSYYNDSYHEKLI